MSYGKLYKSQRAAHVPKMIRECRWLFYDGGVAPRHHGTNGVGGFSNLHDLRFFRFDDCFDLADVVVVQLL